MLHPSAGTDGADAAATSVFLKFALFASPQRNASIVSNTARLLGKAVRKSPELRTLVTAFQDGRILSALVDCKNVML